MMRSQRIKARYLSHVDYGAVQRGFSVVICRLFADVSGKLRHLYFARKLSFEAPEENLSLALF